MVLQKMFCDMFPSNLTVPHDPLEPERRNAYVLADIIYLNGAFSDEDHEDVQPVLYQVVGQENVVQEEIDHDEDGTQQDGGGNDTQLESDDNDTQLGSGEEDGSPQKRQRRQE